MKIVHISDIHLVENGKIIWDTDTKSHFDKAINIIGNIKGVDAIFISGDLADDGSQWSYKYIDESFKSLGIPTYCCPGNHDNIDLMMNEFKFSFINIQEHVIIDGWNFYLLNTAVKGMSRGFLTEEKLKSIEKIIGNINTPIGFILHHPPIEPGGWLNRRLLEDRDNFNGIIYNYPNVKLILFGHIHYHLKQTINNVLYSSASAIGYAYDKELPKFQIADGKEGFSVIEISENDITIENVLI